MRIAVCKPEAEAIGAHLANAAAVAPPPDDKDGDVDDAINEAAGATA